MSSKKLLLIQKIKKKICDKIKDNEITVFSQAKIWGYQYDNKSFIGRFKNDVDIFAVIYIIKSSCGQIFFCCRKVITTYDSHFAAFKIINISNVYDMLPLSDVVGPPIEKVQTPMGKTFVKLKEFYQSIY